jgi:hypothetical protein
MVGPVTVPRPQNRNVTMPITWRNRITDSPCALCLEVVFVILSFRQRDDVQISFSFSVTFAWLRMS